MFRTLIEGQLDGIRDEKQWKKDEADKAAVTAQLDEIGREWTQIAERKKEVKTLRKELDERLAEITKARTEIEKLKKRKKK
jgi:chaperonin cofactor prefoldin